MPDTALLVQFIQTKLLAFIFHSFRIIYFILCTVLFVHLEVLHFQYYVQNINFVGPSKSTINLTQKMKTTYWHSHVELPKECNPNPNPNHIHTQKHTHTNSSSTKKNPGHPAHNLHLTPPSAQKSHYNHMQKWHHSTPALSHQVHIHPTSATRPHTQ